jgi:hypothetical protein
MYLLGYPMRLSRRRVFLISSLLLIVLLFVHRTQPTLGIHGTPPSPTSIPSALPERMLSGGIWISRDELMELPTEGPAWGQVQAHAWKNWGKPKIRKQKSKHDTLVLAGALYAVRTNDDRMRKKVRDAIMDAIGTEDGGRVLALGWNLLSYVIAADVIDLKTYDSVADRKFRRWLDGVRTKRMSECGSLITCSEKRPNNWGTHALASRIAADLYLGDTKDLERAVTIFQGWLGDPSAYDDFKFRKKAKTWSPEESALLGINPKGATKKGRNVDGVLVDDQRRSGSFTWPPPKENYVYTGLQGAVAAAAMLHRAGYPAFEWSDRALVRAFNWTHDIAKFPTKDKDDRWMAFVMNAYAGTDYPTYLTKDPGRNMAWTAWTHMRGGGSGLPDADEPYTEQDKDKDEDERGAGR